MKRHLLATFLLTATVSGYATMSYEVSDSLTEELDSLIYPEIPIEYYDSSLVAHDMEEPVPVMASIHCLSPKRCLSKGSK